MRGLDIKEKIDANNKLIEQLMAPNFFTLNNTIAELVEENRELQSQCNHEFDNGFCIYCYKEQAMEEDE